MVMVGKGPVQPGGGSIEPGGYIPGGMSSEIPQKEQRPGGQNCELRVSIMDCCVKKSQLVKKLTQQV